MSEPGKAGTTSLIEDSVGELSERTPGARLNLQAVSEDLATITGG